MGSVLGSLMGGLFSRKPEKQRAEPARSVSRSEAEEPKAKAAAKVALIKTGGGKQGVLNESTGGRKKLLGN